MLIKRFLGINNTSAVLLADDAGNSIKDTYSVSSLETVRVTLQLLAFGSSRCVYVYCCACAMTATISRQVSDRKTLKDISDQRSWG